jgi:hypothetical protein
LEELAECSSGPSRCSALGADSADDVVELGTRLECAPRPIGSGTPEELRDRRAFLGGGSLDQLV